MVCSVYFLEDWELLVMFHLLNRGRGEREFVFVSHHGPLARLYIMGFGVKTCREAAGTGRTLCVFHSASDIMTTETWSCIDRFHLDGFLASFDTHCVHVRGEVITISGTVVEWKKQ